ncbi:hypothetical protein CcI49_01955 [Frankia sp. CcI49]|nr:hypothetical protein ACG83_09300 [Frankia sp. R43]ONH62186.1 hypothetical protein CcI49_01955 [Frankia sp. CcI49]
MATLDARPAGAHPQLVAVLQVTPRAVSCGLRGTLCAFPEFTAAFPVVAGFAGGQAAVPG